MTVLMRTSRKARVWWVVAVLFTLLNLVSAVVAGVAGEVLHFAIHLVLTVAATPFVWWLAPMRRTRPAGWSQD